MFFLRLRDSRAEILFCSRRSRRLVSSVPSSPPALSMEASSSDASSTLSPPIDRRNGVMGGWTGFDCSCNYDDVDEYDTCRYLLCMCSRHRP